MTNKESFLRSCLVLDTETNSIHHNTAEIVESGFVIKEEEDWTIFQELHKPIKNPIPPKVESITYITNEMVENCMPFIDTKDTFQEVINGYKIGYLVAHNHFFDMKVLSNHGVDTSEHVWLDTWTIAKKLFSDESSIEETNLPYLRFALDLDVPDDMYCHRAGNDSYMTAKLLELFVTLLEETGVIDQELPYGPQIVEWQKKPTLYKRFPWGKHKGELLTDIPKSYWKWIIEKTDVFNEDSEDYDPDLAASIEAVL